MKVIVFVFFAAVLATAQSLECYQCKNCEDIGDNKPSTCEDKITESPPTTDPNTGSTNTDQITTDEITTDKSTITESTITESTTDESTTTKTPTEPTSEPSVEETALNKLENVYFSKLSDSNEILRNYRSVITRHRRASEDWYCYEASYEVNDKGQVDRGCVKSSTEDKCPEKLEETLQANFTNCRLCDYNGCNGSAIAKLSFLVFCIVLFTKLIV